MVIVRELGILKVDGDKAGMFYSLFVGIAGSLSLFVYAVSGYMDRDLYNLADYSMILIGGIVETFALILTIYSASIGIGGIAFALANTCCIYVSLFNYFVMNQPMTAA